MIIEDENFKQKIVDEILSLMENNNIVWKALNIDNNDFMANVKYTYKPNVRRNETKTLSFGYRVCCFGYRPGIIIYDYAYKNGVTDTTDLPSIEVYDEDTKGPIFNLLTKIEESVESEKKSKDEKLLDKFTWYLNAKKKRN